MKPLSHLLAATALALTALGTQAAEPAAEASARAALHEYIALRSADVPAPPQGKLADWRFRDVRLYPTLQPNVWFASFTVRGNARSDGAAVERNVVLRLDVERPAVVRLVEYGQPAVVLATAD